MILKVRVLVIPGSVARHALIAHFQNKLSFDLFL